MTDDNHNRVAIRVIQPLKNNYVCQILKQAIPEADIEYSIKYDPENDACKNCEKL